MYISYEDLDFENGKYKIQDFGYHANGYYHLDRENKKLLKIFKSFYRIEERKKAIDYLLTFSPIIKSAYPLDPLFIDEEFRGYVTTFFENSSPFDSPKIKAFTFEEIRNAINDVSCQLKEVHNRDIIFNDMNSSNLLISATGGHLIDYEDIFLPKQYSVPQAKYLLSYNSNELVASKKLDQFKQYISCLGLLYYINLDNYLNSLSYEDIPDIEPISNLL